MGLSVHQISPKPLQVDSWNSHIVNVLPLDNDKTHLKKCLLSVLSILVKTIQRIEAQIIAAIWLADSVPILGHPAPGSGKMLSLFIVLCDYPVWVTETGAPVSGKTIQPIRI